MNYYDGYGMQNTSDVSYFPLEEFVKKIDLSSKVLEHLEDTNNNFNEYIEKLAKYDEDYIINYWIYLLYKELEFNQKIEHSSFNRSLLEKNAPFFDTLTLSNKRIHEIHNFAILGKMDAVFSYRKNDVNVSSIKQDGSQHIYWKGAKWQDIDKFMQNFIKIYKQKDVSLLMSNPFLKSALIHLLFVRIHPYSDGNGRTARLLHNLKFTESINQIYGTRLKLSPLNLSGSILLNKITYIKCINNIYFDLEHNNNEAINKWFDFMLNMADEQIYMCDNKLDKVDLRFLKPNDEESNINEKVKNKMRIKSIFL